MHSLSRLAVLFGVPALLLLSVSLVAWFGFGAGETGFGPMQLSPLPSKAATPDLDVIETPPPTQLERLSPLQAKLRNVLLPYSHLPSGAASVYRATGEKEERALECLTQAVYYEAGRQSEIGKRGVAQVIVNRASRAPFPSTICGVVEQGAPRPGCQFTFMCDGSLGRRPDPALWEDARRVAEAFLKGGTEPSVGDATHYHADYVFPTWAPTMTKLVQIGAHIFYHWNTASVRATSPTVLGSPPVEVSAQIDTPSPEVAPATAFQSKTAKAFQPETSQAVGESEGSLPPQGQVTPSAEPVGGSPAKIPAEPPVQKPPEVRNQPRRAIPERSLRDGLS